MDPVQTSSKALEDLRSILLGLRATEEAGFEGLAASVVAAKTGLQIRLAKSGLQLGRDASSPAGEFAIAIEAKLYTSDLRIQELMGKLSSASAFLGGDTDLWLLCTTVELGDDTVRKLSDVVPSHGMSIVFLDWSLRPLPPLAVLLAAEATTTLEWFGKAKLDRRCPMEYKEICKQL